MRSPTGIRIQIARSSRTGRRTRPSSCAVKNGKSHSLPGTGWSPERLSCVSTQEWDSRPTDVAIWTGVTRGGRRTRGCTPRSVLPPSPSFWRSKPQPPTSINRFGPSFRPRRSFSQWSPPSGRSESGPFVERWTAATVESIIGTGRARPFHCKRACDLSRMFGSRYSVARGAAREWCRCQVWRTPDLRTTGEQVRPPARFHPFL
jgi:hypothetical protein